MDADVRSDAPENLQLLRGLNEALLYCREHVEYYRRTLNKVLPQGGISTLGEFAALPLTTKEDTQRHYPFGFLGVPLHKAVAYHESSGTATGDINRSSRTAAFSTAGDIERDLARRTAGALKLKPGDMVFNALPYAYTSSGIQFHLAAHRAGAMVIAADNGSHMSPFRRQLDLIRRLNPTVIVTSYPFVYTTLMSVLRIDAAEFSRLRAVQLCGMAISKNAAAKISELLNKVPVYQTYGMSEFGALTYTCERGTIHVCDSDFYVELLNPKTLEPVDEGAGGEIVLTTLRHEGSPKVRYRTGDIGRLRHIRCACGSHSPSLAVLGRLKDLVELDSHRVLVSDIENVICAFPWTSGMFKPELTSDGSLHVTVDVDDAHVEQGAPILQNSLKEHLGVPIGVTCVKTGQARREVVAPVDANVGVKSLQSVEGWDARSRGWLVTY
jgi:phenylacetate-CoA ligase